MSAYRYLLGVLCLITAGYYVTEGRKTKNKSHTDNFCKRTETYNETRRVPYTYRKAIRYTTWCFALPPRCTAYKYETVRDTKNITVSRNRTIKECCEGYNKTGHTCTPICKPQCVHGQCIKPNTCLCDIGWDGNLCSEDCPPYHFGLFCVEECPCLQGATCDSKSGSCFCPSGYTGKFCETTCPENKYGFHCEKKCMCQNDAFCDPKNGSCSCQPGYTGKYCEKRCKVGTHGQDCSFDCVCMKETTESCHHVDGTCHCKPGYEGVYCETECGNFTFGRNCKEKCTCENEAFCDHITGKCYCTPGWTGKKCSKECPDGTFGEDCKHKCQPCPNKLEICDKINGNCTCPKNKICSQATLAPNCVETFECLNNGTCNATTGKCDCSPGWTDFDCSKGCPSETYGENCLDVCNCKNCEWINGTCLSKSSDRGGENASDSFSGPHGSNCSVSCNCTDCEWTNGTCLCKSENYAHGNIAGSFEARKSIVVVVLVLITTLSICLVIYYMFHRRVNAYFQRCCSKIINNSDPLHNVGSGVNPDSSFANPIYVMPDVKNNHEFMDNNIVGSHNFENKLFRLSFKKTVSQSDLIENNRRESKNSNRESVYSSMQQSAATDEADEPERLMEFEIENIYDTVQIPVDKRSENLNKCGNKI